MTRPTGPATNADWLARARRRIPGGVSSPVRAFGAVGAEPFFAARGEGAYVIDAGGRRYVDWVQSWGALILGHAHPAVVDAVQRAAARGTSFGISTPGEVELAEAICARVPSIEMLRFVSSGTEAAMTAVRLARGATHRRLVLKFAGCYHGHADALLAAAGSGVATLGLPGSAGVTPGTVADTLVVPYNDLETLDAALARHGDDLAAILVEPIAANMGLVPPVPGFLAGLRARCTATGALLVFDEVITGFRVAPGGAQELFGIEPGPDLTILGKIVGGGLPLAAVGGRAEIMERLAPRGPVYQAGTLSGNPLATAAALATLERLDAAAYTRLTACADALAGALRAHLPDAQVTRAATLVGVFFAPEPVTNYAGAQAADHERYAAWFRALLREGVYIAPSGFETLFPGLAHDADALARTAAALEAAAARA